MFINCPACHERNPKNASQCLHCNFQLKAAPAERKERERSGPAQPVTIELSFSKSPVLATAATIFAIGFLVLWAYLMMNAPDQKCFNSDQTVQINEYKARGYSCNRDLFSEKSNRGLRRQRICCVAQDTSEDR